MDFVMEKYNKIIITILILILIIVCGYFTIKRFVNPEIKKLEGDEETIVDYTNTNENLQKEEDIRVDSTSWGNYSNNIFTGNITSGTTGMFEETKANNIYDLAGNYWEWTGERYGDNYVMRSGGYNLMGGECTGSSFPAANRDPLPGNDHHPNVSFRVALYLK